MCLRGWEIRAGYNSALLLGNPSGAQASMALVTNYLIYDGYYTDSYSMTKGEPNWVSWHLDATNITNATKRLDNLLLLNGSPTRWYAIQKHQL